jgi:hypothetical protein
MLVLASPPLDGCHPDGSLVIAALTECSMDDARFSGTSNWQAGFFEQNAMTFQCESQL